jgi:geranylgeranyl transferase type-2 subunit alpha
MQHGRKKTPKVILTEEEKAGNKKKLENILKINAEILSLRQNKVYDLNKLEILDNMCLLSSDFYTLWNFRRDIIIHTVLNTDQTDTALQNQNYQFILKELKFLIKAIMRSPKSYTLWFHR